MKNAKNLVRPKGLEPLTPALEGRCSIQLSYERLYNKKWSGRRDSNSRPSPWQGDALPLSHFRVYEQNTKHFVSPDIGKQSFLGGVYKILLLLTKDIEYPPGKPPSNYVAYVGQVCDAN